MNHILLLFQFPSNGKAYLNNWLTNEVLTGVWFQFPSNGKAYLNWIRKKVVIPTTSVSIPFKRESISELTQENIGWIFSLCFNSLQTGKHIWTDCDVDGSYYYYSVFQFPSNGKAYLNIEKRQPAVSYENRFQFPSNGKAYLNLTTTFQISGWIIGFNSLQTGKHIWTGFGCLARYP